MRYWGHLEGTETFRSDIGHRDIQVRHGPQIHSDPTWDMETFRSDIGHRDIQVRYGPQIHSDPTWDIETFRSDIGHRHSGQI